MNKFLSITTALALASLPFVSSASAQKLSNNKAFKDALSSKIGNRTGNGAIKAAARVLKKGVRDSGGSKLVPFTRLAFRAVDRLSKKLSDRQQYIAVQQFLNQAVKIYVKEQGVNSLLLRNVKRSVAQIPRSQRTMSNIMKIADRLQVINRFGTVAQNQDLVDAAYSGSGFPPPTVS